MWPEGDEALPTDAQDLITRLLRQSPMDRLGTGEPLAVGAGAAHQDRAIGLTRDMCETLKEVTGAVRGRRGGGGHKGLSLHVYRGHP